LPEFVSGVRLVGLMMADYAARCSPELAVGDAADDAPLMQPFAKESGARPNISATFESQRN
jgi:hypothetical protein